MTYYAQNKGGAVSLLEALPISERVGNMFATYAIYIKKMILPYDLSVFYPSQAWSLEIVAASFLLLLVFSFIVFKTRHAYPFLIVGWLWYLGTLVPVIGVIKVGGQAFADRYTYIPSIGLFVILVWAIRSLPNYNAYKKILALHMHWR